MLTNKTKDDFIKFINKNLEKTKFKIKNLNTIDSNFIKNSMMKTIQNNKITTIKLTRFLKLLPKKTLFNVPLLITAFFELEKDGWIELESNKLYKTLSYSGREWIPLTTKKNKSSLDIDLALMGIYNDQNLKNEQNSLINEKVCLNKNQTEKTIKNLNERQIIDLEHLNILQNLFLNEFLKIFLEEKSKVIDVKNLKKIKELQSYNEKTLNYKLKQINNVKKNKSINVQELENIVESCLNGQKIICPDFEVLNKKVIQTLESKFQNRIKNEGVDAIMKKIEINHATLLDFLDE